MTKLLVLSDDGIPSGFGRISATINLALRKRGYDILAASIQYDGLLPAQYERQPLPYHVASLAGKPWPQEVMKLASVTQPGVVMVIQDAPYALQMRQLPIDWSKTVFIIITPVDGTPIYPAWVDTAKLADGFLTISQFGVNAYRAAGVDARLCRPGIDANVFYRLPDSERAVLRQKAGIAPDAFMWGMMAQNQGRKDIPDTMRAFYEFAADKPGARLLLDMDILSPAGWDVLALCQQFGWDKDKIISKETLGRAGLVTLNERYNLLDLHSVMAHREGFGLPLVESMACGVATMALDWCSGTEIVGDGRGVLIRPIAYTQISGWGGALDKFPDIAHMVSEAQRLYEHPHERLALAERGMAWARNQNWTNAVDNVVESIERALDKRQTPAVMPASVVMPTLPLPVEHRDVPAQPPPPMPVSVDGLQAPTIQLVEGK